MRITLAVAVACFSLVAITSGKDAEAAMRRQTNIAAQALAPALRTLAKERDVQLVYRTELVGDHQTGGAAGDLTFEEALTQLLSGTGLTYRYLENNAVTIVPIPSSSPSTAATSAARERAGASGKSQDSARESDDKEGAQGKSLLERLRLAQGAQGASSKSSPSEGGDSTASRANRTSDTSLGSPVILEEVVVTAQKRVEKLADVPMSVSVVSGEQLVRTQSTTLQDIANRVPGVQLVATTAVTNQITIRGISLGAGAINSSVATYVDETPYTSQGPFAASALIAPNFDPYDIARVEVLRGPQGTLYGANALGGLLKYVTNAPDPSGFSASALVGGSTVDHGGSGYETHGMVNIPLADNAAFRLVANDTRFPGYIDDPARGKTDINGVDRWGVRAAVLWLPEPDLSIRLSGAYQHLHAGDTGTEDLAAGTLRPLFGDLKQERTLAQPLQIINEIYNATVDWDLKFATLASATSYSKASLRDDADASLTFGPIVSGLFGGHYGATIPLTEPIHSFTQEIRLSSERGTRLEWLLGGYFDNEAANELEPVYPVDLDTGQTLTNFQPTLGTYRITSTYREYAGFANAGYHLTDALEIGLGGRYSENSQKYHQISNGIFTGNTDFVTPSKQNVFTYSADLKYRVGPTATIYTRWATGFVPGGPNDVIPGSHLPASFRSSSTTNAEIGLKGSAANGRISYDFDVFNVNWHDIQLFAIFGNLEGITNGGKARSRGFEGSVSYSPIRQLTLSLNGAYTDARLTQDTPASVGGFSGDRLPESPHFSGTLSADYERPLWGQVSGFGGIDWHYSGDRLSELLATSPRQTLPSYSMVDLRAGVRVREYDITAYVKNVGDVRAISSLSPETIHGVAAESAFIQTPRTVGVTLAAKF